MAGITKYTHNRVDKVLWASSGEPAFNVDGVVGLFFADEDAMRLAQASAVGQKYIPADEPIFLKGWTLCVVETDGDELAEQPVKVLIAFHAQAKTRDALWRELRRVADTTGNKVALNWTVSTARRERLWTEPSPPTGFICVWLDSVAMAHGAFELSSELRRVMRRTQWTASLISSTNFTSGSPATHALNCIGADVRGGRSNAQVDHRQILRRERTPWPDVHFAWITISWSAIRLQADGRPRPAKAR